MDLYKYLAFSAILSITQQPTSTFHTSFIATMPASQVRLSTFGAIQQSAIKNSIVEVSVFSTAKT